MIIWIWVVSSALGLLVALYGIHQAWGNLVALRQRPDWRVEHLLARRTLAVQILLAFIFAPWLGIGLPEVGKDPPLNLTLAVLIASNVGLVVISMLETFVARWVRR